METPHCIVEHSNALDKYGILLSSSYEGTGSASSSHENGSHQKWSCLGKGQPEGVQAVSPKDRKASEESPPLFHAEFNWVSFIFLMLRGEFHACSSL